VTKSNHVDTMTALGRRLLFRLNDVRAKYSFQLRALVWLALLVDSPMTSLAQSPASSFRPVSFENGSVACESAKLSLSLSIYDPGIAAMCPAFEGIPRVVCCAYFCTTSTSHVANCVGFNYRWNVDQCDFYTSMIASSFSTQTGCTYYSVGGVR